MMNNFVEYVVSELKSKRLSKNDAFSLIKQFSRHSGGTGKAAVIHPLLHTNTSDLNQQCYSSIFNGGEFFLADHRVEAGGQQARPVLPGVAYLEMARAAVTLATRSRNEPRLLELHNTVWAEPLVVVRSQQVHIALWMDDDEYIHYEVYRLDSDAADHADPIVHCQGAARFSDKPAPAALDVAHLKAQMQRGMLGPDPIYAAYTRMGLNYGPAHQGITALYLGENQVLARLRLPSAVEDRLDEFMLHPGVMDSAIQSSIGLAADVNRLPDTPSVPFALETLRIFAGCTPEMFAWVRYSPGCKPEDKIIKVDIDLCDRDGKVCVQMQGFSSRVLSAMETSAPRTRDFPVGALYAAPAWESAPMAASSDANRIEYAHHHILLCEMPRVASGEIETLVPGSRCLTLPTESGSTFAGRYADHALAGFELIRNLLSRKPDGRVLIQIVAANRGEATIYAGLAGLLKTAALENQKITGQIILVEPDTGAGELAPLLKENQAGPHDTIIKYTQGARLVLRRQEIQVGRDDPGIVFKDHGVYLITGGLGALGVHFAREIHKQSPRARIILTGRSDLTESGKAILGTIDHQGGTVDYRPMDVTDPDRVRQLLAGIEAQYKQLNGIIHSAGIHSDGYILKKSAETFRKVLAPKVLGTYNLDQAGKDLDLDFMVLFSSIAAVTGNPGQSDYAAANGFLDWFADHRNRLVAAKQRQGRTVAINWPFWSDGGMQMDPAIREMMQRGTGMLSMQTATGTRALQRCLHLPHGRILVAEGHLPGLRGSLLTDQTGPTPPAATGPAANVRTPLDADAGTAPGALDEKLREFLRKQLASLLKIPANRIDPGAGLDRYGINSIMAINLTNKLEKRFGTLPKTLFFEYQTLNALSEYFLSAFPDQLAAMFAGPGDDRNSATDSPAQSRSPEQPSGQPVAAPRRRRQRAMSRTMEAGPSVRPEPIAIIGLSGSYPEAVDIGQYWRNLREGRDCITEVPGTRWDWRAYYSEDRSKSGYHFSKWGGFIEGVDEFDPLFFNITPLEAEMIDPQERLFLQHAWMAVEDAGYTRAGLQIPYNNDLAGQVGVYAGVMYGEYNLSGSLASIANRVSYVLNLHGPCMTLDTMCSSSLTAIHLACQDLKLGRTDLAIAGGVNITIHPNKYLMLSAGQFISSDGHCQSFGEGGDGYIPGEGVGVVILKRLSDAERDRDHIYGVIKGSALNHGGKTNGYTVPNPQAQAGVISRALSEAGIDPRHIGYIEAHGTGTRLGDPIEIAALSKAFNLSARDAGSCLIGSAKSNIGHCESAAGIAGLTKVLLQMKYRRIVPSLHSDRLNPNIDFQKTPFIVNQTLRTWDPPELDGKRLARTAGVSSFGAGGSNAHIIVQEYHAASKENQPAASVSPDARVLIPLSARTAEQLKQKARDLLDFIHAPDREDQSEEQPTPVDLRAMAYTLQTGREAMEERIAFMVRSPAQLAEKLQACLSGGQDIEEMYQGQVERNKDNLALFSTDADLQQTVDKWIAHKKYSNLLDLWVKGLELDWDKLYEGVKPRRISLPVYPFAKVRCWLDMSGGSAPPAGARTTVLHPLLHTNTSDFTRQSYGAVFSGREFFLTDHQVVLDDDGPGRKVLPAVAYLEMARIAVEKSIPARQAPSILELRNTVWVQPLVVAQSQQVAMALSAAGHDRVDYKIYSEGNHGEDIVHCQGQARISDQRPPSGINLDRLRRRMQGGSLDPERLYEAYRSMGIHYGPAYQGITALYRGERQVLAELSLPGILENTRNEFVLNPCLMDSALQAAIGLLADPEQLSDRPFVPFALESVRIVSACTKDMLAWVRYAPESGPDQNLIKLDIDLCDPQGNIVVQMQGLSTRAIAGHPGAADGQEKQKGLLQAVPAWRPCRGAGPAVPGRRGFTRSHVLLCEMPQVNAEQLETLLPGSRCEHMHALQKSIGERYCEQALTCFEHLKTIFQQSTREKVLFHIVAADTPEAAVFSGLTGLLKTAALENPSLVGQMILVPPDVTTRELADYLNADSAGPQDTLVKYIEGVPHARYWREIDDLRAGSGMAFKNQGVYLITGGLGGLGLIFAAEIVRQTENATIILTGRSEISAAKQAVLDELGAKKGRVVYHRLDVADQDQVIQLLAAVHKKYRRLNGIIHSAGMIADNFIARKSSAEFRQVLEPKIAGACHLDFASKDMELDFFVLFSSAASVLGNIGQADYAAANGFMDQFAFYRQHMTGQRKRYGKTVSINWSLWQEGGMHIDPDSLEMLRQVAGIHPMQTRTGMQAFYRSLELSDHQTVVVEGDLSKIRRMLMATQDVPAAPLPQPAQAMPGPESEHSGPGSGTDVELLIDKTRDFIRKQFSALLKLPSHEIDPKAPLEKYGIDSILAMKLTNRLEETFGSLSKTLLFEYQSIIGLARYFVNAFPGIVQSMVASDPGMRSTVQRPAPAAGNSSMLPAVQIGNRFLNTAVDAPRDIAITGISGRYPQSDTLEAFWENLKQGRDCITEIPAQRWDNARFFSPDRNQPGKTYSKWGGFISDVDKFDPLFFNISPREAELIDPQERLFLETAWQTIEDAGYSKESIGSGRVGVFVGVMWGQYQLYGAEAILAGNAHVTSSSYASIANRVSYFFDFRGPSMAIDTMCSSSLTAIHLACQEIIKGEIDAAIAGGVNLSIHPHKYLNLSQGNFTASDGRCRSFGSGGDGYVPGEGVGAVLLKSLDKALADGDRIYAVIKSSAVNHGGKTNGYTVPNPNAQAELILQALDKAHIDPGTLGYIETHGTGTSLGDPIEITGLRKAFDGYTQAKQFCPIGSVKSNIGHLESAAGIAAVTKAVLQIKHEQLAPSLHADPLNPNIDFAASPFYVQTKLAPWKRPAGHPRRAGVSSFGAGGANAHLIIEEYVDARDHVGQTDEAAPAVFVLSAKNTDALDIYAGKMVRFLEKQPDISLRELTYTSQVGRTPMQERLAIIATSTAGLKDKLGRWMAVRKDKSVQSGSSAFAELENVFYGNIKSSYANAGALIEGEAGRAFFQIVMENRDLEKISKLWISGIDIDWTLLYLDERPRRVSMPTYPFARERFWINTSLLTPVAGEPAESPKGEPRELAAEQAQKMFFRPQWEMEPLTASLADDAYDGPILILDTADTLHGAMKARLAAGGRERELIHVTSGHDYRKIAADKYAIDPGREEHYHRLLEDLKTNGRPSRRIIHHGFQPDGAENSESGSRSLPHELYALFYLCRAYMRQKLPAPVRIMSVYTTQGDQTIPENAALGGFFKTLCLENPKFHAKVIEIQSDSQATQMSAARKAGLIMDEFEDTRRHHHEILYKWQSRENGWTRYARTLAPFTPDESRPAELPVKQNGVYLISGGLGGLGFIFGEYLARHFHANLVLFGRSALDDAKAAKLERLRSFNTRVLYLQADVARLEDMQAVVDQARSEFSQIHGVIHSAGLNKDAFILKKTKEEIAEVLAPKLLGAKNLDKATQAERLDIFVLFSSVAGVMGNLGQCDYAYANNYLDSFARYREDLCKKQKRFGKTLSINWPFWEEGGMRISQNDIALTQTETGLCPLPLKEGIQYWEQFLKSDLSQGVALYGWPSRIEAYAARRPAMMDQSRPDLSGTIDPGTIDLATIDPATLHLMTVTYLKGLISRETRLAAERIDPAERLDSFGIDSIMINRINLNLEKDLGALSKTLLYEYETIEDLAGYLAQEARHGLVRLFNRQVADGAGRIKSMERREDNAPQAPHTGVARGDETRIAIVGIHGYYPHSPNLDEYWQNLRLGKELIDLVPTIRWDYQKYFDADPARSAQGRIYCKWGGFLDDFDKFDPLFFNISPEEARIIDPQERLFLQSVWAAIEDAGYTRDSLKRRHPKARSADVGVFAGVTTNSYSLLTAQEWSQGNMITSSALPWSIANRVSYFFDFQGPSMPVDTACSSSLVAIHLACESLKKQECQVAVAGGVNLYLHPAKYHSLCLRRMVSGNGKCRSFGAGGDGFVPCEGVGAIVLKPLNQAVEDQDHIYAVIAGSAYEHCGRSNGYSAPNPNSQARLIAHTLKTAQVPAESISYVEGHGTGTQLGDSLEIASLTQAFRKQTDARQFCAVGSVKSNIGHAESAAGIAGITKIVLQLKHRQLAPTINSRQVNPDIDFNSSPFYLQHELTPWTTPSDQPRRALINSFGAGGVNACMIVEEYVPADTSQGVKPASCLFPLSARTEERLQDYVRDVIGFLEKQAHVEPADLAYTLQSGREAMPERLVAVAADTEQLLEQLKAWHQHKAAARVYQGRAASGRKRKVSAHSNARPSHKGFGETRDLDTLAQMWTEGERIHWADLYPYKMPRRISAPTYPFEKQRFWASDGPKPEKKTAEPQHIGHLHPFVSHNASTLKEVSFSSLLSDTEFYARDHKVFEEKIFPGAGFLEIACICANLAGQQKVGKIKDVVWIQPLSLQKGPQTVRTFLKSTGDRIEYSTISLNDDNDTVVHSEGKIYFQNNGHHHHDAGKAVSIEKLKAQCTRSRQGAHYYDILKQIGLNYGAAFKTMQEFNVNGSFALSKLKIADHLKAEFDHYILHPALLDGAFQTVVGLMGGDSRESATAYLPFAIDEVEILRPLPQACYAYTRFADSGAQTQSDIKKFNIDLLNEGGEVLVRVNNFYLRSLGKVQERHT